MHLEIFCKEQKYLVEIGILLSQWLSEWAVLTKGAESAGFLIYANYSNLSLQHFNHWCFFIEEFHSHFLYIAGQHNVLADALSRVLQAMEGEITIDQTTTE